MLERVDPDQMVISLSYERSSPSSLFDTNSSSMTSMLRKSSNKSKSERSQSQNSVKTSKVEDNQAVDGLKNFEPVTKNG